MSEMDNNYGGENNYIIDKTSHLHVIIQQCRKTLLCRSGDN